MSTVPESLPHEQVTPKFVNNAAAIFCVFRRADTWLALPATSVREVLPRPDMVSLPLTPSAFAGLCHVRSEFIPVVNLESILPSDSPTVDQVLLVIPAADGPWGLLVDQVMNLKHLEPSDAPEDEGDGALNAVVGWATEDHKVIQILDASRIRRVAESQLAGMWPSPEVRAHSLKNQ